MIAGHLFGRNPTTNADGRSALLWLGFALTISPLLWGCGSQAIWGVPVEEARLRLSVSDFSFVRQPELQETDLSELRRLGPEASYYFYYIFIELGRDDLALQTLRDYWRGNVRREQSQWHEQVGLLLMEELAEREQYGSALEVAERFLRKYAQSPESARARRTQIEALYWLGRDSEVLELLNIQPPDGDPELVLFRAVSACRVGFVGWEQFFVDLVLKERVSFLHARAYAFLRLEPNRLEKLNILERKALQAKDLAARGVLKEAIPLLEEVLASGSSFLEDSCLIQDLFSAYLADSEHLRGGRFLEELGKRHSRLRSEALEMAGRVFRKGRNYSEARRLLAAAVGTAEQPERKDRIVWYLADVELRLDTRMAFDRIVGYSSQWADPAYFSDLLELLISELLAQGQWERLSALYEAVSEHGPSDAIVRLAYIVGRGTNAGFIDPPTRSNEDYAMGLYRRAAGGDPYSYYTLLGAYVSGTRPPIVVEGRLEEASGADQPEIDDVLGQKVLGFLRYGLVDKGYRVTMEAGEALSDEVLREVARGLAMIGMYRQSINVARLPYSRNREPQRREELEAVYPSPYREYVGQAAQQAGIPLFCLRGLVREESYYDSQIVSHSGAVGLTQLMPATADEAARRLGLTEPDLTDPEVNLILGARHLSHLYSRLSSWPKSLLAYNAGLSRVRAWEHQFAHLPPDLFVEAIPYLETRSYFKKVLVASVIYAHLDQSTPLNAVLRAFFPDLQVPKEQS